MYNIYVLPYYLQKTIGQATRDTDGNQFRVFRAEFEGQPMQYTMIIVFSLFLSRKLSNT